MGVWWHALAFVTHERAKMSHKPGRNVTQAGPKCHTRAKMSHSHVIIMAKPSPSQCDNALQMYENLFRYREKIILLWFTRALSFFSSRDNVSLYRQDEHFNYHIILCFMSRCFIYIMVFHDDIIKWKRSRHYWSFVRGIHRLWCFLWS